jgi:hypothetical protein
LPKNFCQKINFWWKWIFGPKWISSCLPLLLSQNVTPKSKKLNRQILVSLPSYFHFLLVYTSLRVQKTSMHVNINGKPKRPAQHHCTRMCWHVQARARSNVMVYAAQLCVVQKSNTPKIWRHDVNTAGSQTAFC